ncbi:MAG TPA: methyl-accepting chemotaxis protein [Nitrospirota bacterium]|nr:methyl-accepting chemotaxis protein [Nitrospirota bacterium]
MKKIINGNMSLSSKIANPIVFVVFIGIAITLLVTGYSMKLIVLQEIEKSTLEITRDTVLNSLTTMMESNDIQKSEKLFIDQMEKIVDLKVIRSDKLNEQYTVVEKNYAKDAIESEVLDKGVKKIVIEGDHIRGVYPYIAKRDMMGRNCLSCHNVPEGTILGAVDITVPLSESFSRIIKLQWLYGILGLAGIVTLVFVIRYIMKVMLRPIGEMLKIARNMAAGDLSQEITIEGQNEITELGGAINTMSSNLTEMLRKIRATGDGLGEAMTMMSGAAAKMSQGSRIQQEATEQTAMVVNEMVASIRGVAENTSDMSRAATDASSSASEMASSIEEVAKNAGALAAAAEDTATSIEQMIASIKQVSENTDALAASAEQTTSSITEMSASVKEVEQRAVESARLAEQVSSDASERGIGAASEAIRGMQNIKDTVEATAAVVNRLGKRSQEIGQILKVIDEVTDQTSLLALNAAILAAQAGEHGKGFAVVAEEIKDLAERTAASTQEISGLIASVREETAESVEAMARGLQAVEAGASLVNVTSDVLKQVADSSRQSTEVARAIEKTTSEQAKGVSQITETSVSIAEQIEQIANALQEQRRGSERIAKAAERMRDITRQVKSATQEQTTGSRQIANAVESVTLQAAQSARSTQEQSLGAQQISEAITRIQKITQDTVDVSIEMDMAVQTLKSKSDALQAALEGFKF